MDYRRSEAKEAAKAKFRGIVAAITTPFTPDGQVDEAGLRHNMRTLTGKLGVSGVFCTGIMGEFWSLTKEERKRIVEVVCEEARGKCLVIAHTAHHSAHETVELTKHAEAAGADFAIYMNPYYPPANEDMIYEWFKFVADRVDIGIWMFDAAYSGYGLSPELTNRIADIENVCAIKIPRSMDHYVAVKKLVGDKIVMSQPNEVDWLMLMRDHGQRVHQSSPTPYLYQTAESRPMHDYTELGLAGRFKEAEPIYQSIAPLRALHDKWLRARWLNEKIIPIAYLKAWSEMLGLAGGPVRPPLLQITEAERAALRAELTATGLLRLQTQKAA
jgi:4-hydroxy-tetrahydrodipicolinate synthase